MSSDGAIRYYFLAPSMPFPENRLTSVTCLDLDFLLTTAISCPNCPNQRVVLLCVWIKSSRARWRLTMTSQNRATRRIIPRKTRMFRSKIDNYVRERDQSKSVSINDVRVKTCRRSRLTRYNDNLHITHEIVGLTNLSGLRARLYNDLKIHSIC